VNAFTVHYSQFSVDLASDMRPLIAMIIFAFSIAGCGYKTPLSLPPPKPAAQKPSPPPQSAAEQKKSSDDAVKE